MVQETEALEVEAAGAGGAVVCVAWEAHAQACVDCAFVTVSTF
jgi:hypothetical protein